MTEKLEKLKTAPGTRYVIVDLEATCWQGQAPAPNEIIEIGAVAYEVGVGPKDSFQTFISPKLQPVLSEFCTELTSIRQQDVDAAPPFAEAYAAFQQWREPWEPAILASWGNYDLKQITQDCQLHRVDPDVARHVNLKAMFSKIRNCRRVGMAGALRMLGLPIEGVHHRGIDDAKNIARILEYMIDAQVKQE